MDFKKTNATVIKSMFTQMKKEEFITNAKLLKKEYLEIIPNEKNKNFEIKIWSLLIFASNFYINFWTKRR
jgi:hypothetical protein